MSRFYHVNGFKFFSTGKYCWRLQPIRFGYEYPYVLEIGTDIIPKENSPFNFIRMSYHNDNNLYIKGWQYGLDFDDEQVPIKIFCQDYEFLESIVDNILQSYQTDVPELNKTENVILHSQQQNRN